MRQAIYEGLVKPYRAARREAHALAGLAVSLGIGDLMSRIDTINKEAKRRKLPEFKIKPPKAPEPPTFEHLVYDSVRKVNSTSYQGKPMTRSVIHYNTGPEYVMGPKGMIVPANASHVISTPCWWRSYEDATAYYHQLAGYYMELLTIIPILREHCTICETSLGLPKYGGLERRRPSANAERIRRITAVLEDE